MATPPGPPSGPAPSPRLDLDRIAASMSGVTPTARTADEAATCPALRAATSGVMWLTGHPDRPPLPVLFPFIDRVQALCDGLDWASHALGRRVRLDPVGVVIERAAARGFSRNGTTSANGSCRLLRCQDGWVACNLARPDDFDLIAAMTGALEPDGWEALQHFASTTSASGFAGRAQQVGLPAGVVADPSVRSDPVLVSPLGSSADGPSRTPRVVDFSAMWAGPLCAHTLSLAGADVTTIEDPGRPDGSRLGDPGLHARLHDGHGLAAHSFRDEAGRDAIRRLVDDADAVIESSRPRALEQLGLSAQRFLSGRPGRTWISITGYGRAPETAMRVAFGDDAAAAGGLVGRSDDAPVFLADAAADPVSGLFAAFAGLVSMASGGGHLIDVSMSAASRWAAGGRPCDAPHPVERHEEGWVVRHGDRSAVVLSPAEALALVDA